MGLLTKRTMITVFVVGIFVCVVLSVFGMGYLTQMAFSDKKIEDKYCGAVDTTQRDLARMAVILQWVIICMVVLWTVLKIIWGENLLQLEGLVPRE